MSYLCEVRVNSIEYSTAVEAEHTLLDLLRHQLGLTGPKEGCDDSECGACMVLVDGTPTNSCCMLALQADGRDVTTIEGVADGAIGRSIEARMLDEGGVQCGFCTPGIVISAAALLSIRPNPSTEEIRTALTGNLCRCTGYQKIIAAVAKAAADLAAPAGEDRSPRSGGRARDTE